MNRFQRLFNQKTGNILSVYFTAGFPQINDTVKIIRELSDAGVDMIEIGIPFSDPMADGPVIQHSSQIALNNGMTQNLLFEQLLEIRKITDIPLVLMGYVNPLLQYGFDRFCASAARIGIDGLIIPDLPMQEFLGEFHTITQKYGLENILLITPETEEVRIHTIDSNCNSFIYLVSTASVTGAKNAFSKETLRYFERIGKMQLRNPLLVGFGISNKVTRKAASGDTRGVIVGSAFIKCLDKNPDIHNAVSAFMKQIQITQ
ncbi:MAG: tryptophan synthase subunit alpha [Rikenellaceae bacterium]